MRTNNTVLFNSKIGPLTASDISTRLLQVGAHECDVLFVHSAMNFGIPNLKRRDLLEQLMQLLLDLDVATLVMPTFTFSFCNLEDFDRERSVTRMGSLNEYFRTNSITTRSSDPLLSVALTGQERGLVTDLGSHSIGKDSTYERLGKLSNVKFLFFGTELSHCFTYMHHLEWKARVPYRYDREFQGHLTTNGLTVEDSRYLFVRYSGVSPGEGTFAYEELLLKQQTLLRVPAGDTSMSCVGLEDAERTYLELIDNDANFFISEPFDADLVTDDYQYGGVIAL